MKLLSIDTSTKNFSLAVSDGETILRYRNIRLGHVLSPSIIPEIRRVLKMAGVSLRHIDGFVVGLGPGSFTRLRVGLSTMKGLAFATGKPLVGIPSLDVVALGVKDKGEKICVVSDARRNMVYACIYSVKNGHVKKESSYVLASIEEVLREIEGETVFVGDGIALYQEAIIQGSAKGRKYDPIFADEKYWLPQARYLVPLAQKRFIKEKSV